MTTRSFDSLEEAAAFLLEHGAPADLRDEFYEPMVAALDEIGTNVLEARIKQNLTENDSVATGTLRNSIHASPPDVTEQKIAVTVGAGGRLKYNYAPAVEYGTKPHQLPWSLADPGQPLYVWVRVKRVAGKYAGDRRLGSKKTQMAENIATARAVIASIARRGTRARPFFFRALDESAEEIDKILQNAVDKMLEQLL